VSALIFVIVAVAWAVYLVPKALEHHDESLRSRTVSTFSHSMRVLARREAVTGGKARLVPGASAATAAAGRTAATAAKPTAATPTTRQRRSAAARRRTVLTVLLLVTVAVAGAAALGRIPWYCLAAPVALLVAWLVACRLMVRRERAVRRPVPIRHETAVADDAAGEQAESALVVDEDGAEVAQPLELDETTGIPAVATGRWDPVDVPLPTYVSKPPAVRRTVRTIDLDSTGVWSSGRSESDSALAREAEAARRDAREEQSEQRATGS
jgi:hypothetical protein